MVHRIQLMAINAEENADSPSHTGEAPASGLVHGGQIGGVPHTLKMFSYARR
jgi:hypothetical protein